MKNLQKIGVFILVTSWLLSGWPASDTAFASMTTNSPTANVGSWTNPTNAYADGGSYANITSGAPSATHTFGTYGFSLTGNTITQVRVRADALSVGGATVTTANKYPTSDESNTAAFTTAPLWSKVDDTSNTDYITGVTNGGGHATFGFAAFAIPAGSTITNVTITWSENGGGTSAKSAASLKVGGTYYDNLGIGATTNGFQQKAYAATTNPATGAAWTVAEVNGTDATNPLQAFGVSSSDFNPDVQFGYVFATVTYTTANDETLEVDVSWDGGTTWSPSKHPQPLTGTETTYWIDVTGDTAWTPTKLNDTNFKVRVDGLTVGDAGDVRLDWVPVEVTYSLPISIPSVSTSPATSVETTTATCNGDITATGGENAAARGCEWDIDSGAPYANSASDTGSYGTGAFSKGLTGLPTGTTIYARAFATNSAGTGYGSETSFLTKPAAPTNVVATDGTYSNKVTITWTKSTGATNYHVWRDTTDLGAAGDVATYDDTGADAPTITAGSAAATDGSSTAQVSVSISGQSANNGTTHTYKVVASNATGSSVDSAVDTGYRGVGSLTYQWQRSAADSDASYSDLSGATGTTFDDTGAPADGSGRYYHVVENATGATQQTSVANRGFRAVISLVISANGSIAYGAVAPGGSKSTLQLGTTPVAQNDGNVAEDFNIIGFDTACPWTLSSGAGADRYKHEFSANGGGSWSVLSSQSYQSLATNVAATGTKNTDLRITVPTATSCYTQSANVTVQAVIH